MPQMHIRLFRDPETGKQNIVIKLDSDADALPLEHEQMHRALVEKLIGKGLDPEDLGELVVERESNPGQAAPPADNKPQEERRSAEQRG
jgi:hypothetical protein